MRKQFYLTGLLVPFLLLSCSKDEKDDYQAIADPYENIKAAFGDNLDPDNLANYANQPIPAYITKDNKEANDITDKGASLGRVLFYDKNLSVDNTIACASCHKQEHAFSDNAIVSTGVNGTTGRHSMRLVNARFGLERRFFWDRRAQTLEVQTTMPIQDHAEMGFSGENSDPGLEDLLIKLGKIGYYKELFTMVYGSEEVTEEKMQLALAQFIRSIQSFDSKYDAGREATGADGPPFANFTQQENQGKNLFLQIPVFDRDGIRTSGGAGCAACHKIPEFDIDPMSLNNGVTGTVANDGSTDFDNIRAPTLRDMVRYDGVLNTPLMHTGEFATLSDAILHYNTIITEGNPNLDVRLTPQGKGQKLNLTDAEVAAIEAFLRTLSGTNLYTDPKWGNPFL